MRKESDSLGDVEIPKEALWGAQTERSRQNFAIGTERMPARVIHAMALVKKAAAQANCTLGLLSAEKKDLIQEVCDEILSGSLDHQFPLKVWQTGSGTQSHMNINEVISNRAAEKTGHPLGSKQPLHPNDDINKSQSSNDLFPTAMHIAATSALHESLFPSLKKLKKALKQKAETFASIVKVGRTHLMDATPLTLGQEFSAFVCQIDYAQKALENALPHLLEIALGGTAVGTGLNSHPDYATTVASEIHSLTGHPFVSAPNKFEALAANDAVVGMSAALKQLAVSLIKIANDIRWLGSGPRCGLGEIQLPANEPGSSIMPGKVNPTQCEALTMVSAQVLGNDTTIAFAGSQGNFQLNVYKPLLIYNLLQSITLLGDAMESFATHCVEGILANTEKIQENLDRSLMLATALNRSLGYDKASIIVKKAHEEGLSLKEAALQLQLLSEEEFDQILDPSKMISP